MTVAAKNIRIGRGKEMADDEDMLKQKVYVTKKMLELGVPAHLKGYHYIRSAVLMSLEDRDLISSVTKLLYPDVAKVYGTTGQKVERAIRNAIEVSWQRGSVEAIEEMFGFSADSGKGRPTNSEYIARLTDDTYLHYLSDDT